MNANTLFEVYRQEVGGKTYDGKPIPPLHECAPSAQAGWAAVAEFVAQQHSTSKVDVSDREMGLITMSVYYAIAMPGVGIPNHNYLMLIDKLAQSHSDEAVKAAIKIGQAAALAHVRTLMAIHNNEKPQDDRLYDALMDIKRRVDADNLTDVSKDLGFWAKVYQPKGEDS